MKANSQLDPNAPRSTFPIQYINSGGMKQTIGQYLDATAEKYRRSTDTTDQVCLHLAAEELVKEIGSVIPGRISVTAAEELLTKDR